MSDLGRDKNITPGSNTSNIYNNLPGDVSNNTNPVSNNNQSAKGNIDNLVILKAGEDSERARELGRLGGKACGEAKRRKKTFQEQARALLDRTASRESAMNVLGDSANEFFPEGQATNGELLLARMMLEGWNGNTKAAEFTRDTAGYKPTQEISVEGMDDAAKQLLENVAKRLERESKKSEKNK